MNKQPRSRLKRLGGAAVLTALFGMTACSSLPSQGPTAADVVSAGQTEPSDIRAGYVVVDLKPEVLRVLERKEPASFRGAFGDYRPAPNQTIGVGDVLSVTLWEAAGGGLFSSPVVDRVSPGSHTAAIPEQVVARDGSITVPYAGRIQVAGLTTPAVEQRIIAALAGKAIEPQALVAVSRNVANSVTVSGEVAQGARIPLSPRGDRILDVIASAGGIRAPVHETFVTLSRGGRSTTVPMQVLLSNPGENIFVRPGDTITLVRKPQSFTAFGATGRNALVTFDAQGITLEEAVAKAGGLLNLQADPEGVFLLRIEPVSVTRELAPTAQFLPGQTTVNVVYRTNLRDMSTYFQARRFAVLDKDILYVASAPSTELQKFLMLIQSATAPAYAVKVVAD